MHAHTRTKYKKNREEIHMSDHRKKRRNPSAAPAPGAPAAGDKSQKDKKAEEKAHYKGLKLQAAERDDTEVISTKTRDIAGFKNLLNILDSQILALRMNMGINKNTTTETVNEVIEWANDIKSEINILIAKIFGMRGGNRPYQAPRGFENPSQAKIRAFIVARAEMKKMVEEAVKAQTAQAKPTAKVKPAKQPKQAKVAEEPVVKDAVPLSDQNQTDSNVVVAPS
jgi:hypothetical protein